MDVCSLVLQGDREIPLLERCGLDIALQAARFQDPRFPMVRLQPSVPVLHFYLSPGRLGRLMRVLRAALPGKRAAGLALRASGISERISRPALDGISCHPPGWPS